MKGAKVALVVVRNSELGVFRTCRRRWHFQYVEQLQPIMRARALEAGTIAHRGFAAMYREIRTQQQEQRTSVDMDRLLAEIGGEVSCAVKEWKDRVLDPERWFDMDSDRQQQAVADTEAGERQAQAAVSLFAGAFAAQDFERYEVVAVEEPFDVVLRSSRNDARSRARSHGTIDLALRDRATLTHGGYNDVILVEHKTTGGSADDYDARLDVDPQPRQYVSALRELFPQASVGRVIYNVVQKSEPREPSINKDGHVSVAACATTRGRYEGALLQQEALRGKPRTEKQIEVLESLPRGTERWASRYEFFLGDAELEQWRLEAVAESKLMRAAQAGKLPITRNGASCSMPWQPACPYRGPCVHDSAELRERDFIVERPGQPDVRPTPPSGSPGAEPPAVDPLMDPDRLGF